MKVCSKAWRSSLGTQQLPSCKISEQDFSFNKTFVFLVIQKKKVCFPNAARLIEQQPQPLIGKKLQF